MKTFLIAVASLSVVSAPATAAPIIGSFSLASFSGTYVGGTAATATGLDLGFTGAGFGNGYGTNGSAIVGNATGSFAGLNNVFATVSDILLGASANPYLANPFIRFGPASNIVFNFSNAAVTRSKIGLSVSIKGIGTFSDGNPADTTSGEFSFGASSQNGMASDTNFTFASGVKSIVPAVPEPATWAMMIGGFGMIGFAMRRRQAVKATVRFA